MASQPSRRPKGAAERKPRPAPLTGDALAAAMAAEPETVERAERGEYVTYEELKRQLDDV